MTMTGRATVVGVFRDDDQAERAIDALKRAGFTDQQIGFIRRDERSAADEKRTDMGTRVASGVIGGGVLGGILGAAASLLIPGLGPAIAGGILAATLGGAAIGAAAGGIIGALTEMGVPEEEARYYQGEFEAGRIIVTIRADDRQREAMEILRQYGAYDATTRKEKRYDPSAPGRTSAPDAAPGSYDPNAPGRTYDPNAAAGTYDPNAPGRTNAPNAPPGTYDPNAGPMRGDDNPPRERPGGI